ncbi:Kinase, STE STE20 [Spironucleus salmonicida]|uniref:Kinase, STE STE20 n=1 Tax=Spironucleus salmonicida TaxID=348837 RepID=V6LM38_9EUKA|nr:Kinase, STE STE20 [Spironucleus salmonicida]|eukprot:EST45283.1 Kinase, STE STE20 [Spironucleus salmonicida]
MEFEPIASNYTITAMLGQGTQAMVFKAIYTDVNGKEKPCALKAINLDRSAQDLESLQSETKNLSLCKHKNVCPLYQSFVHSSYLWLVMPQLKVSVLDMLQTLQPIGFEEAVISTIMYDVLQALHYLHNKNQLHRDVKLSNFLLDSNGECFLADFGVAAMARPFSNQIKCSTFVGSPLYMAPEIANNQFYDQSSDIWSFGICMYQLAHGQLPHQNLTAMEALIAIIQKDPPKCTQKRNFTKQLKEVIESCLVKDPKERPTTAKLLEMKFWQKRVSEEQIQDMVSEYCVLKPIKQGAFQEQVSAANQILQGNGAQADSDFWDFDDKDPKELEMKEVSIIEEPHVPVLDQLASNDIQQLQSLFSNFIVELQTLREQNTKLQKENTQLKSRLQLFSQENH